MFSNLQTEGNQWNHYFMPKWLRIFPYQDDLVTIVETSGITGPVSYAERPDRYQLEKAIAEGSRFVYMEFLSLTSRHFNREGQITYEYKGKRYEVSRIADDPVLSPQLTLFQRKYFVFRNVKRPEKNTMAH